MALLVGTLMVKEINANGTHIGEMITIGEMLYFRFAINRSEAWELSYG